MRSQKFDVIGDRLFDPLGFQVGMLVPFGLEFRALPRNGPHVRRGSEHQARPCYAIVRDKPPIILRLGVAC